MKWIIFEISTGYIKSIHDEEPSTQAGEGKTQTNHLFFDAQPLEFWKWDGQNVIPCTEEEINARQSRPLIYNHVSDELQSKDFRDINYKTELISGHKFHPVHTFSDDGLIERTELYYGFQDMGNKGTLVLVIEEEYTLNPEQSSLDPTQQEVVSRVKTRKYNTNQSDPSEFHPDEKITIKIYDTRRKRTEEGYRRRDNVIDILTENVATAAILSGVFQDVADANDKLTTLLITHQTAFSVYMQTGRGTLVNDILLDVVNLWLIQSIVDNPQTQVVCPWMIGMTFKEYIIDKLKGLIK